MTFNNCTLCQHLDLTNEGKFVCGAYPDGIPDEILNIADAKKMKKQCANGVKFKEVTAEFIEERNKRLYENPPDFIKNYLREK